VEPWGRDLRVNDPFPAHPAHTRQEDDSIMETLTSILSRRSTSILVDPGPDSTELHTMLTAAIHAPDHGRCQPWRFVVLTGEDKAAFGLVLEKAYLVRCENHDEKPNPDQQLRERNRLNRAPVVVTVICRPSRSDKIPRSEQRAAVAAATQNLLLAATALGYGSIWRTGPAAIDSTVKESLGVGIGESIEGFVYLGTVPDITKRYPPRRISINNFLEVWSPSSISLDNAGAA
jgi:nitroreductase